MKYPHLGPVASAVAACAMPLLLTGVARADQDYLLTLRGGGIHFLDATECPMEFCTTPFQPFAWEGTVTVTVDSDAAGTFTGDHFVSLAMDSNQLSFHGHSFITTPSVTIADGRVTAIEADWAGLPPAHVTFSDLSVHWEQPPMHRFGSISANARLTPVPEPATAALLAGGLLALAARLCSSRREAFPVGE